MANTDPVKRVYVVSRGWHTGIVVRHEDIADGLWPEHPDFAPSGYVEVGWGDWAFYLFSGSDIVAIGSSVRGLEKLTLFVQDAYAKTESGRAMSLGPGSVWKQPILPGRGRYHLLNTCNNDGTSPSICGSPDHAALRGHHRERDVPGRKIRSGDQGRVTLAKRPESQHQALADRRPARALLVASPGRLADGREQS